MTSSTTSDASVADDEAPRPPLPKLPRSTLNDSLLPELYKWSLSHGLMVYKENSTPNEATMVPLTAYPTPIPRKAFEAAIDVQLPFNQLYAKISTVGTDQESSFISKVSSKLAKSDPTFTGKLWTLQRKLFNQPSLQSFNLGIFRSDYLIDKTNFSSIKQVEFNTISVSFAGFSNKVAQLHSHLNRLGLYDPSGKNKQVYFDEVPVSNPANGFAKSMKKAIEFYSASSTYTTDRELVVAFIIQRNERNVFDQKCIEDELWESYGIKSIRLTFDDVVNELEYVKNDDERRLIVKRTGQEIAVVYYRTGYTFDDYISEKDWDARFFLEQSFAIKAPNLLTQLSGTKKIQQLLTDDKVLSQFIGDDEELRAKLNDTFVKIYPLDNTEMGEMGKKLATDPKLCENYVLKPQREGGGNNIYKKDIPKFLSTLNENEWDAYILMELIHNEPSLDNIICRNDEIFPLPILSELGIYGTIIFDDKGGIYYNHCPGWLLRSKFETSDEGGVVAGFGCLDSVFLY
ncbi:glutathione synthase NDAI_0A08580 [Naumovozyma dairenensis CBS 421]|uniref:Glutathione synthetase n=1 Tax=Naumovozyma dairenensis (strain ATCC 10597 / BCRC 20456 / CBS 421 / NBRC 0211 / NRRL Y-12639) TaxID=1071378 RepID=G0W5C3_NAUDC|nr:hypothetical protein NDAI_0A08580 [Naumovozyma dairenensis CBS 421]CCD23011.1 hypothetical protein NDAI_0A08580 [Naumovozyma dairenensis CBS 421]